MKIFLFLLVLLMAYIFGSIPWALIIGKTFYKKDIRNYGSHNLGGSNTIRTLGLLPGITVIILDSSKAFLFVYITSKIDIQMVPIAGLFVCIGHCYPIFANFKGGKAVACALGYVLGINLFIEHQEIGTVMIPAICFIITLLLSRYMSLSSMVSMTVSNIMGWFLYNSLEIKLLILMLNIFIIYKHKENIKRIINNNENKMF